MGHFKIQNKTSVLPRSLDCDSNHTVRAFDCAVVFVGAEAGMREFNSGFHGADRRSGTVRPPLASLVCVITAPFSSRRCFCGVASERLMGWKKTLAQRYGSRSPLCLCLLERATLAVSSTLSYSISLLHWVQRPCVHFSYRVKEIFVLITDAPGLNAFCICSQTLWLIVKSNQ